jgi:hypothetical protein
METPKEKAIELLHKFVIPPIAICAVDLLLEELPNTLLDEQDRYEFWEKVKIELEDF